MKQSSNPSGFIFVVLVSRVRLNRFSAESLHPIVHTKTDADNRGSLNYVRYLSLECRIAELKQLIL